MKKEELKKIALSGFASGLLISSFTPIHAAETDIDKKIAEKNKENIGYHVMSEEELLSNLNAKGKERYESLDAEGKQIAIKVASMSCNGTNPCKGYGACKTDSHDCAGQNECRGQGKCAVGDKNFAVKLVYDKMQKKRAEALKK